LCGIPSGEAPQLRCPHVHRCLATVWMCCSRDIHVFERAKCCGCRCRQALVRSSTRPLIGMNLTSDRWAGVFYAVAGFNNVGMSLLDASVVNFLSSFSSFLLIPLEIPFQRSVFFLTIMGILMLAGNTA
jgi:hypothetical protein